MPTDKELEVAVDQANDGDDPEVASPSGKGEGGLVLPLSRVKRLIRAEADVKVISSEATYLIGRAAELVLDEVVARAHASMCRDGRKAVLYKDVANAVAGWDALDFLADVVPQKVLVSKIIQQQQEQQKQKQDKGKQQQPQAQAAAT